MDAGQHHGPIAAPVTGGGPGNRPPLGLRWRARGPPARATRADPPRRRPDRPCRGGRPVNPWSRRTERQDASTTDGPEPAAQRYWSVLGPHGIGATGSGWTRAVTTGRYKSQLEAPLRPRARLMEYGGGGLESHPTPAAGRRPLPTRQARSGHASPRGRAGAYTARPHKRRPRRPCHDRAIHSGLDRSPADNHGQRHSGLDLRRSPSSQVTTAPDLALSAGGRRFESGGSHHQLWLPS